MRYVPFQPDKLTDAQKVWWNTWKVRAVAAYLGVPLELEFVDLFKVHTGALITINASNELINLGGGLGARYALTLAPLGLVQAITSTSTLFVFLFGIVLSIFCPALGREDLSGKELAKKGFSAVLIVVGVILVSR